MARLFVSQFATSMDSRKSPYRLFPGLTKPSKRTINLGFTGESLKSGQEFVSRFLTTIGTQYPSGPIQSFLCWPENSIGSLRPPIGTMFRRSKRLREFPLRACVVCDKHYKRTSSRVYRLGWSP